ncbi:hypothetical protein LUU34_01641600 [Aix galericulata]|nr:hypothetical protein LUU34_01641600 [Aix galericulata]
MPPGGLRPKRPPARSPAGPARGAARREEEAGSEESGAHGGRFSSPGRRGSAAGR